MEKGTKLKDWLIVASLAEELPFDMTRMERPFKVGKVETPENLNGLTIGQLISLSEIESGEDVFFTTCEVVLGMSKEETAQSEAVEVVSFAGWVSGEVKKINRLFEQTNVTPSPRELKAGIKKLQFGMFGLLDWYALRMGIKNHDEVEDVPWLRIYKCLDMDTKKGQYQKKLEEVIQNEYRRKR